MPKRKPPHETYLPDAIQALKERLAELAESHEFIECKAEGMLEAALNAVELAADLLGELV